MIQVVVIVGGLLTLGAYGVHLALLFSVCFISRFQLSMFGFVGGLWWWRGSC